MDSASIRDSKERVLPKKLSFQNSSLLGCREEIGTFYFFSLMLVGCKGKQVWTQVS